MDTIPGKNQQVTYINDARVFVSTGETTHFGPHLAVRAHLPDGEEFWLLVRHCTPVQVTAE